VSRCPGVPDSQCCDHWRRRTVGSQHCNLNISLLPNKSEQVKMYFVKSGNKREVVYHLLQLRWHSPTSWTI
jgi:hypothetical protein